MLKVVTKNEIIVKVAYQVPYADRIVKADLRYIGDWQDGATIDRVYSDIGTANRTSKQTERGRFHDLDPITLELLAKTNASRIHDIGVSNGITSVELVEALERANVRASLVVSDRYAVWYWIEDEGGTAIYDVDRVLRYAYRGGLFGSADDSPMFPISRIVFRQFSKTMPAGVESHEIELYHPALLRLIRIGKVQTRRYDVFTTEAPDEYDYVRCMNLLNPKYFVESDLLRALRNIANSVRDGGVFQVGRTRPTGVNHVSFLVRRGNGFEQIREVGKGSDLKPFLRNALLSS